MDGNYSTALPDNVNSQILHFLIGDRIGESVVRNGVVHISEALDAIKALNRVLLDVELIEKDSTISIEDNRDLAERLLEQFYKVFPKETPSGYLKEDCVRAVSSLQSLQARSLNGALREASMQGSCELAKTLIYLKADVSKTGASQKAPLHIAIEQGQEGLTDLLISSGAELEQKRHLDETAIFLAIEQGNESGLSRLIAAGANVLAVNYHKLTPLHIASRYGQVASVKMLLEAKALLNARNTNKRTPLHLAARHGHLEVVRILLTNGANPKAKDIQGKTSAWEAEMHGYEDIEEVLKVAEKSYSKFPSFGRCFKS